MRKSPIPSDPGNATFVKHYPDLGWIFPQYNALILSIELF